MLTRTFFARAPLAPGRFAPLPAGAITAQGALRDRLISLRGGLLSRCASVFPESGEGSVFFGGTLPSGMRAPELLDAMLLTGALLGDEELRREALRLVNAVIDSQREDGSFGADESFAARGRMLRAVAHAYTMTGEKRMLTFMLRYMKYLRDTLADAPLSASDAMHAADTLESGIFLYNITGQKAVLSVLTTLLSQGADYTTLFHAFPHRTPISRTLSEEAVAAAMDSEDEGGYVHNLLRTADAANLCEGLRASMYAGILTGSGKHLSAPEAGLARMNKAHGSITGAITGDPLLAGTHPSRGVSAVAACELASSLEALLTCPGNEQGADQLEALMYNAIDAAFSADERAVQPVQQANQTRVSREARFPLSGENANLFSLEDGDALCALLAAWPRFAQNQWLLTRDDGLCAMGYAPCSVRYRLGGVGVRLNVASDYPASGSVKISVHVEKETAFPLYLHIPAWAKGATCAVSGEIITAPAGKLLTVNRQWHDGDELLLTLPMTVTRVPGFHQAVGVSRGPLRFVYAPKHTGEADGDVMRMQADPGFGAALPQTAPLEAAVCETGVTVKTRLVPLPRWGMRGVSCDQPPIALGDVDMSTAFDAELVPYAKAAVRIALMPSI